MGLFWTDMKPRVTEKEFHIIRNELASNNFTLKERDRIEEIFRGDLFEGKEIDNGLDEKEITATIVWMKEHIDEHHISLEKINFLESKLIEKL